MNNSAIIFAGPSLTRRDRETFPQMQFMPPVGRGDVLRLLKNNRPPRFIGIVDGFFGSRPGVLHKEILEALSAGCHVYGAASMGALRASELSTYGMIGIGEVFEAYHDGRLESDAEVAVNHGPAELGYPALNVAQVDVDATLDALRNRGMLTAFEVQRLSEKSRKIYYPKRTWSKVAAEGSTDQSAAEKLQTLLAQAHVQRKRLDAIAMLNRISKDKTRELPAISQSFAPPLTPSYKRMRRAVFEP
ncbi:TfuA-like protein [Yoonia sediminilitoris]|uniref:TfuA-like core domain-containing protein n=1 Tax=Yoonia sediminilitoris TaxID=1286148 RepID=A0A2T6KFT2_9RHOB|nr:TfuA-like protein [Yoonia sediminilitoris]PUB14186.1 hypothetical protein C8N45_10660 [Yoonia sediminilitoris]RCW95117.1 hypothetical protein DFP92_10660 [Yoonia sediminilitoris]